MNAHQIVAWITAHPWEAIGYVMTSLSALAVVWGAVKAAYVRAVGKPMPRNALTLTLDVLAELASNALGAYNRARGGALFSPPPAQTAPPRETMAPPPGGAQ